MSETWTVRRVLGWTGEHFEKKGIDSPRLTAEVLLAHTLNTTRVRLYVDLERPLEKDELASFRGLIERRAAGEPTQYLTGVKEFYNRPFQVDGRVLIPRPETELLVEAALRQLPRDVPLRLLDLCTGSGCIAVTLAAERPLASVWAVDLSPGACEVARHNAEALGVGSRVTVLEGDLFGPLPAEVRFHAILSNPPYLSPTEIAGLAPEVRREPTLALDGGVDGLSCLRRIAEQASVRLRPEGFVGLEISESQGDAVAALLTAQGYANVRIERDLAQLPRYVFGGAKGV